MELNHIFLFLAVISPLLVLARAWHPGNLSAFRFGYNGLRVTYPPFGMLLLRPLMVAPGLEQIWLLAESCFDIFRNRS